MPSRKSTARVLQDFSKRVLAEHSRMVDEIIVHRPGWDRAALLAIGKSYGGGPGSTGPGIWDVLQAVKLADQLEAQFKKPVAL